MDNARKSTPAVCLFFAAPVSISTTEQTNRKPQHTKTAARLWKAARPRPFFWRVEAFRPLRRYIVRPAAYRAAGGERPKASTKRDPPRPMQYRRARRVETIQTRAGDTTPARANVDNTDTQTKAPPVWERPAGWNTIRRPAWRPYAPPLNVGNTDNTRKRTPAVLRLCPPRVFISTQKSRKPQQLQATPRVEALPTPPPCGGYTIRKTNGRPLRIENDRKNKDRRGRVSIDTAKVGKEKHKAKETKSICRPPSSFFAPKSQQYTTRRTRGRKYSSHPPKGAI